MKQIKRYIIPAIFIVMGIWMIANQITSLKIIGIIMVVLSTVGITLHVLDRDEARLPKILYCSVSGLIGAVGAFILISPDFAGQLVRYLIGGIIMLYAGATGYRMYRNHYKTPYVIAAGAAFILGILVFFITMDASFFPIAAGGAMILTGASVILGQILGQPGMDGRKILKVNSTPIPVPNQEASSSEEAGVNPPESRTETAAKPQIPQAPQTQPMPQVPQMPQTPQVPQMPQIPQNPDENAVQNG